EVLDGAAARLDPRRAGERRDRAGAVVAHLVDHALERERLVRESERAARDGGDERDDVAVAERAVVRRVLLVDGVEQSVGLGAEVELAPHVADRGGVDLPRGPAGTLAQPGEQADSHTHAAK